MQALQRIYEQVLEEDAGKKFVFAQSTFEAVEGAVHDWAVATGNIDHDVLTQRRLEELELDAAEIRTRGSVREGKGSAKHAAIVMVEHVLGVPERTT